MDNSRSKSSNMPYVILIMAILVLLVGAGSFYGGIMYQKNHTPVLTATDTANAGVFGGQGGFRTNGGIFGSVTAVSSTSITVEDTRMNTSKTMAITSGTVVTESGVSSTVAAIKVGDTVVITASETDTSTATRILLNPTRGGAGPSLNTGGSTQSTDSTPL